MPKPITSQQKATAAAEVRRLFAMGLTRQEVGRRLGIPEGTAWNIAHQRPSEIRPTGVGARSAASVLRNARKPQSMPLVREEGTVYVDPASWGGRSKLATYWNAIDNWRKGDSSLLQTFKGKYVLVADKGKRQRLYYVTDPAMLRDLDNRHQLTPREFYHKATVRRRK